ncbi:hypothetical protein F5141DRAFT_1064739 [Pisolithus sp. B1]|nr:hypothetical protein F5141DRAFT_1064739 [Pisolithus sp. B1]
MRTYGRQLEILSVECIAILLPRKVPITYARANHSATGLSIGNLRAEGTQNIRPERSRVWRRERNHPGSCGAERACEVTRYAVRTAIVWWVYGSDLEVRKDSNSLEATPCALRLQPPAYRRRRERHSRSTNRQAELGLTSQACMYGLTVMRKQKKGTTFEAKMADGDIPYSRDGRTGASASQDHGVNPGERAITLVDGRDHGCRAFVKFSVDSSAKPCWHKLDAT